MRRIPQVITVGVTVVTLMALGLTYAVSNASAAVAATASLSAVGCPSSLATTFPSATTFTSLETAVSAATNGQTIYVCAGSYNMSAYPNGQVDITPGLAITIDGYNWDSPPSGSDTSSSVDPTTQSEFEGGAGILVQSSAGVTISGLTMFENNAVASNMVQCPGEPCGTSIDVQRLISGSGDQGESNVTISNNLIVNTGGSASAQVGDLHFGLGGFVESGPENSTEVTALDTNDVVEHNVFVQDQGFENNGLEMTDTFDALVSGNTVTYPANGGNGADDYEYSGISFPGYDQGTTITNNTLNGGGMFSDAGSTPDTGNPKSGIKVEDVYGDGCGEQDIADNTISGFVYGISIISTNNTLNTGTLCTVPSGPTNFIVSNNNLTNSRIYGIFVSTGSTSGTISGNVTTDSDSEGYTPDSYTAGQYDYYDASGNSTTNVWPGNRGDGSSDPSSIDETSSTTTTLAPSSPPPTVITTTTTTAPPPTTTTTLPPKPSVSVTGATLSAGSKVLATVRCAKARCAGTFELTKRVTVRVKIGHSSKYKTIEKAEVLGTAGYSLAAGTQRQFSIQLNALGEKLLHSSASHHVTCELTVTSAGGTKHKVVTLDIR